MKKPSEVGRSTGLSTSHLEECLVAGPTPLDEGEESNELTARQDLFQQLQEKELQATLKCILSVPSGAFRLSQPVKTEHE